ncbi:hypothetical protein GCM10023187_46130 [Nibrella viscosa]|uniref:DUF1622 domain-containing protein n=1 Tax=Nibrella viscosa TaxID=1084524 RepID=A0ABP8KSS7_9BACT
MEELVKLITMYLAWFIEAVAAVIIGTAAVRAVVSYSRQQLTREAIRLAFGSSLALALEFLLAADILETAVAPTWNDIGQLAAIAVLRTALNYFLERELRHVDKRDAAVAELS